MSDDENEVSYFKRDKVLHYGSLEEKERQNLNSENDLQSKTSSAIEAGIAAGNINISDGWYHSLFSYFFFYNWHLLVSAKGCMEDQQLPLLLVSPLNNTSVIKGKAKSRFYEYYKMSQDPM